MKRVLNIVRWMFLLIAVGICLLYGADKLCPLNLSRFEDHSTLIYAQDELAHVFYTSDDKWRTLTKPDEVSALYLQTLIAKEDKNFRKHLGVSPTALIRASYQWVKARRVISGASTITMQTARLLEPRKRTLLSKLIECFRALQLEWHFSKDEILTIYLTLAPMGGNIEGVHAASMAYFNKLPSQLNASESALLIALLQSPSRLNPCYYPEKALVARAHVLDFMANHGFISESEAKTHKLAPLPKSKSKPPREMPHLAWRLKKQFKQKSIIHSTIDLSLQKKIEFTLHSFKPYLPAHANAAILVVDHQQKKSVAYVASKDYFDEENHGFVDYISAVRSPGSTLKPFIYALGFDMGYINKDSLLLDERRRFGAYYPRNFDKETYGTVSANEALAMSLNTPVVDLLNQIGVIRFVGLLKEADINAQFPKSFDSPSLAIALGGVGLTLEQLVTLYTALAQDGKVKPFSYINEQTDKNEPALFSNHVAKQISGILATQMDNGRTYSLKTGTSYGHRDALVIAYDNRYVIGIWIGRPDGSPLGNFYARDLSVPLLQKVVNIIPQSQNPKKHEVSQSLHFKPSFREAYAVHQDFHAKPTLLFPVDDSVIALEKEGAAFKAIPLAVSGGKRPYTWLIDGEPLTGPLWQQKQFWTPKQPGFYTIAVIDSQGATTRAHIELRSN
ncbi:MAG: penicillin-binding protein 1C [Proteobacteria bacterium]|nr:penicillin-binding protein 1C [Pseudomonadota bacterium]